MDAFTSTRRIAWVCAGVEVYGLRQAILNLAGGLRARGWKPQIISLAHGPFADECDELGFENITIGLEPPPKLSGSLLDRALIFKDLLSYRRRAVKQIRLALGREKPDAVHFLQPNLVPVAGALAKSLKVPCFWEMPNYVGDNYPLHVNKILLRAMCARYNVQPLSNSAFTASTLGSGMVKPIVFHLGVDADRFNPDIVIPFTRAEVGIPEDAVTLGIFARICPAKGQHIVLRAALELEQELGTPLHLVLLGGPTVGPEADQLTQITNEFHRPHSLHMFGQVPDPERYYGLVDIPVNARVDPEPFGLSVVEAMMMRKPVLVHASGGPAETVADAKTGWHVTAPTVEAFKEGIRRALNDRGRWAQMGDAARAEALEKYSLESMTSRYERIVTRRLAA
ncbi:MAG: glycosyltransferase family 4 protein [Phycisphaerales bacterium]